MSTIDIFLILFCFIPTLMKIVHDRNGTTHPNFDWLWVIASSIVVSYAGTLISDHHKPFWSLLQLCGVFYISVFPYLINIVLYKNKVIDDPKWYDHLSLTAWPDKVEEYRNIDWRVRMFFLVSILIASIMLFLDPCKIISYYSTCKY